MNEDQDIEIEDNESDEDKELKPIKEKDVKVDDKFRSITTHNGGVNDKY